MKLFPTPSFRAIDGGVYLLVLRLGDHMVTKYTMTSTHAMPNAQPSHIKKRKALDVQLGAIAHAQ
jgi:hypothetical protein